GSDARRRLRRRQHQHPLSGAQAGGRKTGRGVRRPGVQGRGAVTPRDTPSLTPAPSHLTSPMPWQSVRLLVDSKQAELLSDALMEAGALSVSLEDADAGTLDETPLFGEPDHPSAELWPHSIA